MIREDFSDIYNSSQSKVMAVLFTLLLSAAAASADIPMLIGGYAFYKNLFYLLAVCAIGVFYLLIKTDLGRIKLLSQPLFPLLLAYLFPILWSLLIWVFKGVNMDLLRRSLSDILYVVPAVIAIWFLVYVAGEDAPWYFLVSLILGNFHTVAQIILKFGIVEYLYQFWRLLITFTKETGELMDESEVQGITYGLGVFLVFFAMEPAKWKKHKVLLALTILFFLLGLKRVAVLAIIFSWLFSIIMRKKEVSKLRDFFMGFFGFMFIVGALAYVIGIHSGLMGFLESIGLFSNGRKTIYEIWNKYYEISPFFLGNGAGWVSNMWHYMEETKKFEWEWTYRPHNDYVWQYIELGMIGMMSWCYIRGVLPVQLARKYLGERGRFLCLAIICYILITFAVEQSALMPFINQSYLVILLSWNMKYREQAENNDMLIRNRALSDR